MDRRTLDEITAILNQIETLRRRLDEILAANELQSLTKEIHDSVERIHRAAREEAERAYMHALAQVNFRDSQYKLLRVIDGDTLEVLPPEELHAWMRDIHIRLYGVDAPESNSELGPVYSRILEKLCSLNEGRLHVVWERERKGTEYAGYSTGSFERGIGNLFVDVGEGVVLYVNAVLASLPDVQIERGPRRLIRVARHVRDWPRPVWRHWHHHWPFWPFRHWPPCSAGEFLEFPSSSNVKQLRSPNAPWPWHHPWFVWGLPEDILPPRGAWPADLSRLILTFAERCGCPVCEDIAREVSRYFPRLLEQENATPFDLFLLLAYAWGHSMEEEKTPNKSMESDK